MKGTADFWWEGRPSSAFSPMRDDRGTMLLFDREGALFQYDAAAGRARYDASDVERLVGSSDLLPKRQSPLTWTQRGAFFNPAPAEFEPGYFLKRNIDWVAGDFTKGLMPPLNKAKKAILDRIAPERKP